MHDARKYERLRPIGNSYNLANFVHTRSSLLFALFHRFFASSELSTFLSVRCSAPEFDFPIPCSPALTLSNTAAPVLSLVAFRVFSYDVPRAGARIFTRNRFSVSFDRVYKLVKQIPRGRVLTYGALARAVRLPGGARTAGRAMAATPRGKGIPWHRVLGAGGKILIREPYASLQKRLLESEGIHVLESRINLKKHLWNPPRKKSSTVKNTRSSSDRR
jgi:methylated-DNA-protein-cysteine methyltransferase-like protein